MEQAWTIRVIGCNNVLNQLVAMAVQGELHLECQTHHELTVDLVDGPGSDGRSLLVLVDDSDQQVRAALIHLLRERGVSRQPRMVAALFNMDPQKSEACQAVRSGVAGLFFRSDSLEEMLQGVTTLLNGEVWIPREVLVDAATGSSRRAELAAEHGGLTMRETEILTLVSTGATNDQIADRLCISPHTVKTHMYNIFRKIGVDNRFRAALWVTRNLGGLLPHQNVHNGIAFAAGS